MSSYPPPASTGPVPNHLAWAIIVTVLSFFLCCFSCITIIGIGTGITAIVYASKVNGLLNQGQLEAALQASRNARLWSWITTGILIAGVLLSVAGFFFAGGIEGYQLQIEELRRQVEALQRQ